VNGLQALENQFPVGWSTATASKQLLIDNGNSSLQLLFDTVFQVSFLISTNRKHKNERQLLVRLPNLPPTFDFKLQLLAKRAMRDIYAYA
jgi:hypothetical protein